MERTNTNTTGDLSTPAANVGMVAVAAAYKKKKSTGRPPWMEKPSPIASLLKALVITFIVVVMLFPFLNVLAVSLSTYKDTLGGLTFFGTLLQMIFTTTMAWGLSRPNVPGSRFVLIIVLMAMLISPGIIPMFLMIKEAGLYNTYAALLVPGLISSFNLIIVRQFFMNLPTDLIDSARLDGASEWSIFRTIALPLSKAVLAVVGLFYAVGIWNAFFNAILYLKDAEKWPVQLVLRQYVLMGATVNSADFNQATPLPPATLQMAIVVVATVPILIVYPFLQRYFTEGVLTGAIKG
jgi:ABC-type glycerol-3-phosphate transport system permease component